MTKNMLRRSQEAWPRETSPKLLRRGVRRRAGPPVLVSISRGDSLLLRRPLRTQLRDEARVQSPEEIHHRSDRRSSRQPSAPRGFNLPRRFTTDQTQRAGRQRHRHQVSISRGDSPPIRPAWATNFGGIRDLFQSPEEIHHRSDVSSPAP